MGIHWLAKVQLNINHWEQEVLVNSQNLASCLIYKLKHLYVYLEDFTKQQKWDQLKKFFMVGYILPWHTSCLHMIG